MTKNYSQEKIDKQAEFVVWQTKLATEPIHDFNVKMNEAIERSLLGNIRKD